MSETDTYPQHESLEKYAWVIITALFLAQLVMSMGAYAWGPLAPFIKEEYGVSRAQIGMITSSLYLTSTIIAIPSGILVDRLSARIMLIICLFVMGIAFCAMAMANTFYKLVACVAVSGVGYGIINQVSTKGIMLWFTTKTRATAMGLKQTGVTLGGAVAAALFPLMTVILNWKTAMFLVGCLMIIIAVFSYLFYKEQPNKYIPLTGNKKDIKQKGSLLKVLSNPILIIVILILPFMAFSQICVASFLVLYLKESLQFPISTAGTCLTIAMIFGTVGRLGWGIISDKLFNGDRLIPSFLVSIIGAISAFYFAVLTNDSSIFLFYILSGIIGLTLIGWNAVIMTFIAELAGAEMAGSVMGIVVTTAWVGIIVGPTVFGYIADNFSYFAGWSLVSLTSLVSALGFIYIFLHTRQRQSQVKL